MKFEKAREKYIDVLEAELALIKRDWTAEDHKRHYLRMVKAGLLKKDKN